MKPESICIHSISIGKRILVGAFVLGIVAMTTAAHAQTFSVVHNFSGGSDGGVPYNGFIMKGKMFYGTASVGGSSNNGVIFKMNAKGGETVLHNFAGGTDGANPEGELIQDKSGHFYGTTTAGGAAGAGTVFKLTGKKETVLYSFAGGTDGAVPVAGLTMDASGNLYGTTSAGGANGNGTVFELTAPKKKTGQWTQTVLYSFGTGTDGSV